MRLGKPPLFQGKHVKQAFNINILTNDSTSNNDSFGEPGSFRLQGGVGL